MAARLVEAGWAEELDPGHVPTALANVRDEVRGLSWDPEMRFHFPWQSLAIGLGYNLASTGRDLTSIADLFDPALAGKVTLLPDMWDTLPLVHLALQAQGKASDHAPDAMTVEDAQAAIDYLRPFVHSGHIRAFTGSEYLTDLGSGATWAAMVWSGDFASSAGPDDVFVYPEEGWLLTSHSLVIPKGAEHKHAAELMIDWVFRRRPGGPARELDLLHQPREGRRQSDRDARCAGRKQPAPLPTGGSTRSAACPADVLGERGDRARGVIRRIDRLRRQCATRAARPPRPRIRYGRMGLD